MKPTTPKTQRTKLAVWITCALAVGAAAPLLSAKDPAPGSGTSTAVSPAANQYIGAKKCKSCHSSESSGDQYGAWEESKHAKAWDALASDEAKAIAAERGIADPQKADECVKCHVTAHGVDESEIKRGFKVEMGVQCETCHGPGDDHMKARFAAAAADQADAKVEPGEILGIPPKSLCIECHNEESPTFEQFCYHWFSGQISHLQPDRAAEVAALGISDCSSCHAEGAALIEPQPALCTTCHDPVPAR